MMIRKLQRRWVLGLGILFLAFSVQACAHLGEVPTRHVVMFDRHGDMVDPTGNVRCQGKDGFCRGRHSLLRNYTDLDDDLERRYIRDLLTALRNDAPKDGAGVRRVLLYVHGGLNTQKSTVERAVKMHEEILNDGGYYPIFINWQSSLISSYFDHLLFIRQGKEYKLLGPVSSPVYLVSDAARAVSRMPIVWGGQLYSQVKTVGEMVLPSQVEVNERADQLAKAYRESLNRSGGQGHPGAIAIETGEDDRTLSEKALSGSSYIILLPIRMFVAAPLIDGFGTASWDTMLRRTQLLFRSETEFGAVSPGEETGGLSRFMTRLREEIRKDPGKWEITLVGHSMGTIVLNEMIRRYPDIKYSKIIYMAAACSIRDFESSVVPYLETHPDTEFYDLALNRTGEERERFEASFLPYVDPAIRGSLLSWIDLFLSNPLTFSDRSLGKFANFVRAEQVFPEQVRGRVHVKEFSLGKAHHWKEPQKHGEFDEVGKRYQFRFWYPDFYEPDKSGE